MDTVINLKDYKKPEIVNGTSQYSIYLKAMGMQAHFKIGCCSHSKHGVHLEYYTLESNPIAKQLDMELPQSNIITGVCVINRWYHRLFKISFEKRIKKEAVKLRAKLLKWDANALVHFENLQKLRGSL